jgi:diguanylate cyclase (GGDEF)-like protein
MICLLHTTKVDGVTAATMAEALAESGPISAPGASGGSVHDPEQFATSAVAGSVRDAERLAALRATGLLDTLPEPAFDRLTRLAVAFLRAPTAAVSLVDDRRQFFKSAVGLGEPWASRRETPLSHSFCRHVVEGERSFVVDDAREHPLVCDNLAVPELGVRAYLGVPLKTASGHVLGALCVIDGERRRWGDDEVALMSELASLVMTEIELRLALAEAKAQTDEAVRVACELARKSEQLELLRATAAEANAATTSRGALRACLSRVCAHMGWPVGHVYVVAPGESRLELVPTELWRLDEPARFESFREVTMQTRLPQGFGLPGRVLAEGQARWRCDDGEEDFVRQGAARASGLRGGFAFPVLVGDEVAAVLEFYSERAEGPDGALLEVVADLGLQLGRVFERERSRVILERHAAENQALSVTDVLTGLHNRRGFLERAAPLLERATRAGKTALIFFAGLNELKQINDGLGHGAGDEAIREAARLLRATFCEFDVVARFGGGEFVALRPEGALDLVETLRGRLCALLEARNAAPGGCPFRLSVSLGAAMYDPHRPRPLELLLAEADVAMQEQKRQRELAGASLPAPEPRVTALTPGAAKAEGASSRASSLPRRARRGLTRGG